MTFNVIASYGTDGVAFWDLYGHASTDPFLKPSINVRTYIHLDFLMNGSSRKCKEDKIERQTDRQTNRQTSKQTPD